MIDGPHAGQHSLLNGADFLSNPSPSLYARWRLFELGRICAVHVLPTNLLDDFSSSQTVRSIWLFLKDGGHASLSDPVMLVQVYLIPITYTCQEVLPIKPPYHNLPTASVAYASDRLLNCVKSFGMRPILRAEIALRMEGLCHYRSCHVSSNRSMQVCGAWCPANGVPSRRWRVCVCLKDFVGVLAL